MVDDIHLHSIRELVGLLREQPGYEVTLDLGKALVFRKLRDHRELSNWLTQPYIARRSRADAKPPRWQRRLQRLTRRLGWTG